ncbi:unnamed protein product [Urochloa humidicola]
MGIPGDDVEDLGAEELLRSNYARDGAGIDGAGAASGAAVPPETAAGTAGAGSVAPDASPSVSTAGTKRPSKRSKAWNDFDEVFQMVNGKRVRMKATCKHCGKVYSEQLQQPS